MAAELIDTIIATISTNLWYIAMAIIVPLGVYFTIRIKGIQITKIPETCKILKKSIKEKSSSDSISGFQAFCTTMGSRVGVGNIAGIAAGIVMGGPGTIFWMWVFTIILASVSFAENIIGQIFKEKQHDGLIRGGPAYYIKKGLGKPRFSIIISVLLLLLNLALCGVQSNQACASVVKAFPEVNLLVVGIVMTIVVGIIYFGGIRRVASLSEKIVPIMVLVYLGLLLVILIANFTSLGAVFASIFTYAFGIRPFVGGGVAMMFLWALKRSIFSTDTGTGLMPHMTASAKTNHPVTVGLTQAFGTFVDIILCTLTGMVILLYTNQIYPNYNFTELGMSATELDALKGTPLVSDAFSATFLGSAAPIIMSIFLVLFAFTSLIAYYFTCEANLFNITKKPFAVQILRISLLLIILVFSQLSMGLVWDIADSLQAILAIINLVVLCLLSKFVIEALRDYMKQKKDRVVNPVFTKDALSNKKGVTEWDPEESRE